MGSFDITFSSAHAQLKSLLLLKVLNKVRAGQMNEVLPTLVSTGTSLADQTWQGQCENSLYSRHDQNTEEGVQLSPLSSQNVTENSNLSTAQEDREENDHIYTYN